MIFYSALFSAVVTWLALWLLTRRSSSSVSLRPVLWICLGITLVQYVCLGFLGEIGLLVSLIILPLALYQWCCLPVWKAILVALAWLGSQIIFGLCIHPIF